MIARIAPLLICLFLPCCGGGDFPLPQAKAQASCGSGWWGAWQAQTGAWCGNSNPGPGVVYAGTNGTLYAMHTSAMVTGLYTVGIGDSIFSINDNPGGLLTWGRYTECDRMFSAAWDCIGHEIDVANNGNDVLVTPYSQPRGNTTGLQIGCGSGWPNIPSGDCSTGINIVANPKPFLRGITIFYGSVQGPAAPALNFPTGMCIYWWNSDGSIAKQLCG